MNNFPGTCVAVTSDLSPHVVSAVAPARSVVKRLGRRGLLPDPGVFPAPPPPGPDVLFVNPNSFVSGLFEFKSRYLFLPPLPQFRALGSGREAVWENGSTPLCTPTGRLRTTRLRDKSEDVERNHVPTRNLPLRFLRLTGDRKLSLPTSLSDPVTPLQPHLPKRPRRERLSKKRN